MFLFFHSFGVNSRYYLIPSTWRNRSPSLTVPLALSILTPKGLPLPGRPPRDFELFRNTVSTQGPRQGPIKPLSRNSCFWQPDLSQAPVASMGERQGDLTSVCGEGPLLSYTRTPKLVRVEERQISE